MQLVFPWLQFGLCVVAIGLAGPVLTRSGQAIARLTGMSASWVGLIMLAGIFYGAQYGSSTAAILLNIPGTATAAITCNIRND